MLSNGKGCAPGHAGDGGQGPDAAHGPPVPGRPQPLCTCIIAEQRPAWGVQRKRVPEAWDEPGWQSRKPNIRHLSVLYKSKRTAGMSRYRLRLASQGPRHTRVNGSSVGQGVGERLLWRHHHRQKQPPSLSQTLSMTTCYNIRRSLAQPWLLSQRHRNTKLRSAAYQATPLSLALMHLVPS